MKNQALYSVIFEDGSNFQGGNSYFETNWLNIPNKKIKRIFYRLPDGNHLCLREYDNYCHMIEATKNITGKTKGITKIEYAYIMGRKGNKVTSYRITLFNGLNNRYKLGDIIRREFDINDNFVKGLNLEGWK